ncbi:MAG: hypothetical protein NTZ08_12110 [Verrucomicrobia bacterium]|nr:hypothetical protein [Verrucomicrobiota bacterium]
MNTNKTDKENLRRSRSPFVKIRSIRGSNVLRLDIQASRAHWFSPACEENLDYTAP